MNHVSDVCKHPDFYKKDWLVLGTGPSLDRFIWEEHRDKNILAIYSAIDVCKGAFIHISPDEGSFKFYATGGGELQPDHFEKDIQHIVTRAFNSKYSIPKHFLSRQLIPKIYYFEYDCDVAGYSDQHDGFFHGGDGNRYFPFHEVWPCANTAKAVSYFLGKAGIKKAFTMGIDGGNGLSENIGEQYKSGYISGNSFDKEVADMNETALQFGLQYIKL